MPKPNLKYKIRGAQDNLKEGNKIFFTCAEEDFDKYFESESNSILRIAKDIDCTI